MALLPLAKVEGRRPLPIFRGRSITTMYQSIRATATCFHCKTAFQIFSVTVDDLTVQIESLVQCPQCTRDMRKHNFVTQSLMAAQNGISISDFCKMRDVEGKTYLQDNEFIVGSRTETLRTMREINIFWNSLFSTNPYLQFSVENAVWQKEDDELPIDALIRDMTVLHPNYAEIWNRVGNCVYDWHDKHTGKISHDYIPLTRTMFARMRRLCGELSIRPNLGCDLGAGLGNGILHLALFCEESCGIEINPKYIRAAPEVLCSQIEQGDILTADLSSYDLLYFYCPFKNYDIEREFENGLAARMKPGAYLIPIRSYNYFPDLRLIGINEHNYQGPVSIYQKPL